MLDIDHDVSCRTSLAAQGANKHGTIVDFSKSKGHGFIRPDVEGSTDNIFLHISEWV